VGDYGPREEYGRIRERSYRRGGWDRERRLQTTIVVGAAILFLVGIGIGFGLGRASAPKPVAPVTAPIVEETTLPAGVVEEVPTDTIDSAFTDETSASAETSVADTTPPPRPKQLAPANGAVLSTSRVNLRWSKVTDDIGPVTYSFEIQNRRSNGTYGNTQIIKGLKATSYSARVLQVRRRWRVWAVDAEGNKSTMSPWRTYIHKYVPPAKSTTTSSTETT
jgi:hypothetical protein